MPQAPSRAAGLLVYLRCISDRMDYSVRFSQGGGLIETQPCEKPLPKRKVGGLRGAVTGFSKASRLRMIKRLAAIKRAVLADGLWIDLTYPHVMQDGRRARRDLFTFLKRLKRAFPGVSGIWKMELQERGAIHFHIMGWGADWIPHDWLAAAWYEICDTGNPDHLAAGTSIHAVHSAKRAGVYASKYQSKEVEGYQDIEGRWWGMFGDWKQHLAEVVEWIVDRKGISHLWRVFDRWHLAAVRTIRNVDRRRRQVRRARQRRCHLWRAGFLLCEVDGVLPHVGRLIVS